MIKLLNGDCLEEMRKLQADSVDAIVTDPPAGISFMGKEWDHNKGGRDSWITWMGEIMGECHRVLKPGGHALVWALPRTSHWTGTALENAGFEIRDVVTHLFGTGFPKSMDISKAIDKLNGDERPIIGKMKNPRGNKNATVALGGSFQQSPNITSAASAASAAWNGWGTTLKPASENWILCRKPISEKTIVANVLKWGTGGLNIDASRIGTDEKMKHRNEFTQSPQGRFPANLILDETAAGMLDAQSGPCKTGQLKGQPSRFFYCAKASGSERNAGLDGMPEKTWKEQGFRDNETTHLSPRAGAGRSSANKNHHPCIKAQKLMQYLIKLITPPNGIVLDPFMGSGSTGVAAKALGYRFMGIEKEKEYFEIAEKRIGL